MKTYPAPPFAEVYIIQLPYIVKEDKALNWTDRIVYWFFVHHKGDSAKVLEELGLSERRFREIKGRLAARGHIARIEEKGQIKYIAVDIDAAYLYKIDQFRKASTTGFAKVPDQNIFKLKLYHTYGQILHVMEVLEFTYRIGKTKIKNPHHLLTRSCKTGVTPHPDFVPGFWEKDLIEKERQEKQGAYEMVKQAKAEERRLLDDRHFGEYLKSLGTAERKKLEERARIEAGPFFAFVSKKTRELIILGKMKEIVFNEMHKPGNA